MTSAVSFGTLPIFGKLAYAQHMNVQSLLATRFILAATILFAVAAVRGATMPRGRTLVALLLLGAVGYVGQSAAYFNSIRYVPAAVTSILLYTYPVLVTLASWPLFGVRIGGRRAAALGLALAGTALVASPHGGLRLEGILLGLASAVVYSGYILTGKLTLAEVDPWLATAFVSLAAGVVYLVYGVAGHTYALPPSPLAWLWVAGLSLVATVVGAGAFLAGLRLTDAGRASLISTLEPVSTATLAAIVFGEKLSILQLTGGGLVLLAVVLTAPAAKLRRQE
ncbi:MAG: DMT family transporter [Candidatus Dormibacteria bacterium]